MKKQGFTLVELSIVLVIIGLLIGGILAAQSMIRWTKLQSLQIQVTQLGILVSQFKMTYGAYPSEVPNPTAMFPQICNNAEGACYCPDGSSAWGGPTGLFSGALKGEGAMAELQAVGMVPMGRSQIYQDGTSPQNWTCFANNMQQTAGLTTRLKNVFGVWDSNNTFTDTNALIYGAYAQPIMTGAEALALDKKFDDGLPNTGLVRGGRTNGGGYCTAGYNPTDGYYDLATFTCNIEIAYPSYYNNN